MKTVNLSVSSTTAWVEVVGLEDEEAHRVNCHDGSYEWCIDVATPAASFVGHFNHQGMEDVVPRLNGKKMFVRGVGIVVVT